MRPLLLGLLLAATASADAIVSTQAMTASTIAEIFVERGEIRAELEIGGRDVRAFADLLPEEMGARVATGAGATDGWGVFVDGRKLQPGSRTVEARRRVRRDEITGEPLGRDGEPVLFLELSYPLGTEPAALTIRPPGQESGIGANIGFVLYHGGIAVNDFRYLGRAETARLDWEDPWFSRFESRNLRRRYDAPLNVFLYVDYFEIRKEIIVRPHDLQQWVDLGLGGKESIAVAQQEELKRRVAEFLAPRARVLVDGEEAEFALERIHFVRRTLRRTGIIDPPEELPVLSATLGVIFVHPRGSELPQRVEVHWDLFGARIDQVPGVATDEAGGMPTVLTPDEPVLAWQNFLTNPRTPTLARIAPPRPARPIPLLGSLAGAAAIFLLARRRFLAAAVLVAAAVLLWPYGRIGFGGTAAVDGGEARVVLDGLLRNVYRAFDYRDEDTVYDTLDRSVHGDLLTRTYLETRRALELANQGGARVRVQRVEIEECEPEELGERAGFRARCAWRVEGSVGHWGHTHVRRNRYEAVFEVEPVDGAWKIAALELLSERRL